MKFIHIADVHLGANPDAGSKYSQTRETEIWDAFSRVIECCKEQKMDLLLIAGDLFHRQPLMRELKEVNALFASIPDTQVVMVAGNHDWIKGDSYYLTFEWSENVHMILSRDITCVELPKLRLAVYGLSYYTREITESLYAEARPQRKQPYEILLAHGGDDKHIPIQKQELLDLGYDYIALGHIHKPAVICPGKIAYAGALEPTDKNDIGAHGYIEGEITEKGCKFQFLPAATREYIHTEVPVDETVTGHGLKTLIQETIMSQGVENIYKITVTGYRDVDVIYDLSQMDTYGNIVELIDATNPAYDFARIKEQNKDNILGKFIERLEDYETDSLEYQALCEGVRALMETRRG